ncbi:MAG: TolC family protein [Gammaproteobacteria bacterium]|nr:TolC family protein [Gammaproteobacteria bacterium]
MLLVLLAACNSTLPTRAEIIDDRAKSVEHDLAAVSLPADAEAIFDHPLTLEEALDFGLRNNLTLRLAEFEKQLADDDVAVKKLEMLPNLNFEYGTSRRDSLRKTNAIDTNSGQVVPYDSVLETKTTTRGSLVLSWDVLDFMVASVRAKQAGLEREIFDWRLRRNAQKLALDITESYWKAAVAEDALDHIRKVEEELETQKSKIEIAIAEGRLDPIAAKDAEVKLLELALTIRQLQANLSKSRLELAKLMGLHQSVNFTLARTPIEPILAALPRPDELDISSLETYALHNRPELFEQDMQVRIQREEARTALLRMFPGVNLFVGRYHDRNPLLFSNTWSNVGANLSLDLFQLPSSYARLKGSEREIEMVKAQRLMVTVGVLTQTNLALLNYAIRADRFLLLEDTYGLSEELLSMTRARAEVGKLSKLAVTQRLLEEMAAKLRRDEAVVDLLVAHKRLLTSIGVNPSDFGKSLAELGINKVSDAETVELDALALGDIETAAGGRDAGASDASIDAEAAALEALLMSDAGNSSEKSSSALSDAVRKYLWAIQLGAFELPGGPARLLKQVEHLEQRMLDPRDAVISKTLKDDINFRRVRFIGLPESQARSICEEWGSYGGDCWLVGKQSSVVAQ